MSKQKPKPTPVITTLSSREFNQDVSRAKRAAEAGPVVITDRGEPAYVLLRIDAYRSLISAAPRIRELLDQPGVEDIEFDPPRFGSSLFRAPDLS
jgi:PHD/YefM family antitoxin component YafN of YafNO toxin-antitoxin module